MIVDVEANHVRFPFDGIDVKAIRKILAGRQCEWRADALLARVTRPVDGAVHGGRFLPDIFHDVDFAARGPMLRVDVVSQHPEGGPDALPAGDLNPRFKTPVRLLEFVQSLDSCRGVAKQHAMFVAVALPARCDHELSRLRLDVLHAVGVVLEFMIAPSVAPGFDDPFGGIRYRTLGAIEFIAPLEGPWRGLGGGRVVLGWWEFFGGEGIFPSRRVGRPVAPLK